MLVNNLTATQSAKVNTAQEGLINICGLHSLLFAFHSKVLGGETEPRHQKKNPAKTSVSDGGLGKPKVNSHVEALMHP